MTYANGASVAFGYTNRGDLTDHDLSFAAATGANYDYAYNGVAQLVSRQVSDPTFNWLPLASGTDAYAVNGLNQYTSVGGATPAYDGPAREGAQTDFSARRRAYGETPVARGGILICRPSPTGGNLTTDTQGRSFAYDAENVLRTASGLASGTASYRYHADGPDRECDPAINCAPSRAGREKTAQGATTRFYYMGGLGYLDEEDTQFAADPG